MTHDQIKDMLLVEGKLKKLHDAYVKDGTQSDLHRVQSASYTVFISILTDETPKEILERLCDKWSGKGEKGSIQEGVEKEESAKEARFPTATKYAKDMKEWSRESLENRDRDNSIGKVP